MGHWGWGPSLCQPWMGRLVSPRMEGPLAARMRKPRGSFRRRKALSHPRRRFLLRGRRHTPLSLTASAPSCLSPHFTQEVTAAQRGAATCPRSQRMSRESAWVLPGTAPSFPASGPLRCRDRASQAWIHGGLISGSLRFAVHPLNRVWRPEEPQHSEGLNKYCLSR